MANKKENNKLPLLFVISLLFYSLTMLITKIDTNFSLRWLTFFLWIFSILIIPGYFGIQKFSRSLSLKKLLTKNNLPLLTIIVFALTTRFLFLKSYPFVAIFDEVRDGGLNAWEILNGSIKNIHGYGRYDAHGLIIPTLTRYFYLIFKSSVFAYRFPAALVGFLDILVLFSLSKKMFNSRVAFLVGLTIICSPIHLFYSRTEIVIIFSSLFASLILYCLYFFLEKQKPAGAVFLGLTLGFSFGLHAGVKAFAFWTLIFLSFFTVYQLIKKGGKKITLNFILLVVFLFIGFGPRIFFTSPSTFFHTSCIPLVQPAKNEVATPKTTLLNFKKSKGALVQNYLNSMAVYFKKPIGYHSGSYPNRKPVLTPPLFLIFVIGLLQILIFSKKIFPKMLILYALLIPLTNSALTGSLNASHRLITLLPICALIIGSGVNSTIQTVGVSSPNYKKLLFALITLISCYICVSAYEFFNKESASKLQSFQEYLSMYAIYSIEKIPSQQQVCFLVSPQNYNPFELLHFQEQRQFFLPQIKSIKIGQSEKISENQVFISKDCLLPATENFLKYQYCQRLEKFVCPLDYHQKIEVFIEKPLLEKNKI